MRPGSTRNKLISKIFRTLPSINLLINIHTAPLSRKRYLHFQIFLFLKLYSLLDEQVFGGSSVCCYHYREKKYIQTLKRPPTILCGPFPALNRHVNLTQVNVKNLKYPSVGSNLGPQGYAGGDALTTSATNKSALSDLIARFAVSVFLLRRAK